MPPKAKKEEPEAPAEPAAATVLKGEFTFPDSDHRYVGEYVEVREPGVDAAGGDTVVRKRHGVGLHTGCGERYEGEWRHDQIDGRGSVVFADGTAYVGEFRAGQYHGTGRLTWPDLAVYDGTWHEGRMHGSGVLTDADGNAWRGLFWNDTYQNDKGVWIPVRQSPPINAAPKQ